MRRSILIALFAVSVMAASLPGLVYAQVDGYHMTGINFNFANPGARARGIGGAFVALADDATAGIANPAGLAFLDRQFTLELIHDEQNAPVGQVTQGGATVSGAFPYTFTAENDPFRVWAESTSNRINHASLVFPAPKLNLGFAVYYASLADLDQNYEVGTGIMCLDNGSPYTPGAGESCEAQNGIAVYYPQSVLATLETDLVGFGVGWKLGDSFSIGGSAAYVQTKLSGSSASHPLVDPGGALIGPELTRESDVSDNDLMYSLGLLYRGSVIGLGLNYRSGTTFKIDNEVLDADGIPIPERAFTGEFRIPERLAAGIAVFPGDHWVIAAEYVRIPYSEMPEGMMTQFDRQRMEAGVEYEGADVNEIHIGGEYTTFGGGKGWSIRAGYWREQTHLIYSSQGYPDPVNDLTGLLHAEAAFLYPKLTLDFDHYTVGFGAAFGVFRLDLAVDYSPDAGTDFLLSGVFYF
jgi:hypothetical protein